METAMNANRAVGIHWPSFQGQAGLVGTSQSGRVTVYVDPTLGQPGQQNAHDLLADADRVVRGLHRADGAAAGRVNVIVFALGGATDGTGGADHMGIGYVGGTHHRGAQRLGVVMRVSALFEAELS